MSIISLGFAYVFLGWSFFVLAVQVIGITNLYRYYARPAPTPASPALRDDEVPHITILRPVKGLETDLYECLASTLRQIYPRNKITIYMCVDSTNDPAYPTLRKLLADFPKADARVFVETEDPLLHGPDGHVNNLGPNPKVRNLSHAYREAKGDIVWVVDANIWVGPKVGGRMVDKLCGFVAGGGRAAAYKFVHQLPVVVDTVPPRQSARQDEAQGLLSGESEDALVFAQKESILSHVKKHGGGRLEEMFMATTHAKFYGAINAVGIAPCIVGKSNMWRKSHLLKLTDPNRNPHVNRCPDGLSGLDYFSRYICEDHMIGDLLFKSPIAGFKNHGLVQGDIAVQPVSSMSVKAYIARRVRWLRARKWTVLAATLVEPGVESLLCNFYFSFAATTIPWLSQALGIPQTWRAMGLTWLVGVTTWMVLDWFVFGKLHRGDSTEVDLDTPHFARGTGRVGGLQKRPLCEWLAAWLGRELLALPIWTWAVLLGTTVNWRGNRFKVRPDMSVVELDHAGAGKAPCDRGIMQQGRGVQRTTTPEVEGGLGARSKDRFD
ncbi:hypothetical protein MKZ38_008355 [Zalerion maritima]|uniref:Ceramide glucosyltransferase n=1 Tax=Zalerion maritima TaxID=339359 RepID=A0AAD5RV13_9PEZI|nr:hypothetical protein MKZ38_008355 [Zalerion maritima]